MPTILWKNIGGTLLIVHARVQPDPIDWAALMRDCVSMARSIERALVFADVTLTAEQRRQVADVHKAADTRAVAVITSSSLSRMIVTALSWINGVHKAFDPRETNAALDYLAMNDADRREVLATALTFARELQHKSLEQMLSAA
jgi:hypothetical protein